MGRVVIRHGDAPAGHPDWVPSPEWLAMDAPARERCERTTAWIRARIGEIRAELTKTTPGPWEFDGDDVYCGHDAERGDRVGDLVAHVRTATPTEAFSNGEHIVRFGPDQIETMMTALSDTLLDLERIATRAPHPDAQMWARLAIGSLAAGFGDQP